MSVLNFAFKVKPCSVSANFHTVPSCFALQTLTALKEEFLLLWGSFVIAVNPLWGFKKNTIIYIAMALLCDTHCEPNSSENLDSPS